MAVRSIRRTEFGAGQVDDLVTIVNQLSVAVAELQATVAEVVTAVDEVQTNFDATLVKLDADDGLDADDYVSGQGTTETMTPLALSAPDTVTVAW